MLGAAHLGHKGGRKCPFLQPDVRGGPDTEAQRFRDVYDALGAKFGRKQEACPVRRAWGLGL